MTRLLLISLLFISFYGNTQTTNRPAVSYQIQAEVEEFDTLLVGIQDKIQNIFIQSIAIKDHKSLTKLSKQLDKLYQSNQQNIILYWHSYLQLYSSIYHLSIGDKKSAEQEIDRGIKWMKDLKNKNSEDYALLAMLQGFGIQFKGMKAIFIAKRIEKNIKQSLAMDSLNLRAYYVSGSNDFYTPVQYGGGQKAEKLLLKAISLPSQTVKNTYLPSWGKEEAYELLIKLYLRQEKREKATKYFQEGIKKYPNSDIIKRLSAKIITKTTEHIYPFKVDIKGNGKPIILIPGLACSGEVWKDVVDSLQNNYQCHTLTLAGFSDQKPLALEEGYLPIIQNELSTYIDREMDQKPIIIGHSLGGFLALSIASTEPNSINKIILVDSYPFLPLVFNPEATAENMLDMATQMKENMVSSTDSAFAIQQEQMLKSMITDSTKIQTALDWSLKSDRETVAQAMFEIMTTDLRDKLRKINVPIFIFGSWYGYKDYGATKESVKINFQNQFSQADQYKILIAEKAKHFIMWDEPVWFINKVKEFLVKKHE